jgi:C-terminal processing protease CtpA/Prc
MSGIVDDPLWLDFSWELHDNSDHWSFVEHRVPVALLHTGLHSDYHRPSDDVEKVNRDGMRDVSRYLLAAIIKTANEDQLPTFRSRVTRETKETQRSFERPLPKASLAAWPSDTPPPRLGISWREDDAELGSVMITRVIDGTPAAAAGVAVHDRIYELNGKAFENAAVFQSAIAALLAENPAELTLLTERRGHLRTVSVKMPSNQTPVVSPAPAQSNAGS